MLLPLRESGSERFMRARVWMAIAIWPLASAAGDPALAPILDCMRANIPPTVRIQTIEVKAWDRTGGERQLKGKLYGTREDERVRVMMRIEAPQDLAGAAYLVREGTKSDEMHLYLPSVRKVRRITGASLDGQLWGTDLSYNDVKQIQNAFTGADVVREPAQLQYEGRTVNVLSFAPRKEDVSRYKAIRTLVDEKTCVALMVEFLEPSGVRKTLAVKPADLKQSGPHWYASRAEIKDLKNGTRTELTVTGVTSGDKLATRYFNPQTFYLGN
jgi:hypothetical protein